jgi:ATP-binding cassette, subfamily F, member 3
MLSVNNISKSFGLDLILDGISFSLNTGECLGLVGPNGSGKTTLLRILVQQEKADSGSVQIEPADTRVGYLPQGFNPAPEETMQSFLDRIQGGNVDLLNTRLEELAESLSENTQSPELQHEYDQALAQLILSAESSGRAPGVMDGLGLGQLPMDIPIAHLSGGQKTRLSLAGLLLSNPQMILLDEPTNHLDLDMLTWLEEWLNNYAGAALVVSHDRTFLDHTATSILEIDPKSHKSRVYTGNYSDYLEQKMAEHDRRWQEYTDQQDEVYRLRAAASHIRGLANFRRGGKADTGDKFAKGFFANRSLGTVKRAKQIEKRVEHLLNEDRVEKPKADWEMKIEFGDISESGRDVISLEHLSVGYGDLVLLEDLNLVLHYGQRVALIGPNGSGKTSLLKTILGKIPPLAGRLRLGTNVNPGYMAQEQENLDPELNSLQTVQKLISQSETEARSFLSKFLFKGDDVFIPVGSLSYGERSRLSLARLVATGCNLLMLDEPINHLDIPGRSRFEQALKAFEGTVLAVVHDRYFIQGFATYIWQVNEKNLLSYPNAADR